jgi:hypothetical protein
MRGDMDEVLRAAAGGDATLSEAEAAKGRLGELFMGTELSFARMGDHGSPITGEPVRSAISQFGTLVQGLYSAEAVRAIDMDHGASSELKDAIDSIARLSSGSDLHDGPATHLAARQVVAALCMLRARLHV